jgi:hypothetical protein
MRVQVIGHHLFGHWLESVGHVARNKRLNKPTKKEGDARQSWAQRLFLILFSRVRAPEGPRHIIVASGCHGRSTF